MFPETLVSVIFTLEKSFSCARNSPQTRKVPPRTTANCHHKPACFDFFIWPPQFPWNSSTATTHIPLRPEQKVVSRHTRPIRTCPLFSAELSSVFRLLGRDKPLRLFC